MWQLQSCGSTLEGSLAWLLFSLAEIEALEMPGLCCIFDLSGSEMPLYNIPAETQNIADSDAVKNAVGVTFPPTKVRSFIHEWPHFVNRTHFSPHSTSGRTRSWPLFIVSHFLLPTKSLKYVICSLSCILIMAKVSQYKCQKLNDTGSRGRSVPRPPLFTVSKWGRHNNDIKK